MSLGGFFFRGYSELAVLHDEPEPIDAELAE